MAVSSNFLRNDFYQPFDSETFGGPRGDPGYRSAFQQDRDRIGHCSSYRRLQGKTQVFPPGEYDFYRTRLTHTNEVALIGRGICEYLRRTSAELTDYFYIDADLVEACCMAHDLGHPPFGHAGERSLHRLMRQFGGFEGNAQTLRLLSKTLFSDGTGRRNGMNPTRSLLDGVLKYKKLLKNFECPPKSHFVYDDQTEILKFVADSDNIVAVEDLKSIECQIMDWADDTAYALGDLVDGVCAKFITTDKLERWAAHMPGGDHSAVGPLIEAIRSQTLPKFIAIRIGEFIRGCSLRPTHTPLSRHTARHRYRLHKQSELETANRVYKDIAFDLVFKTAQVQQLEYKGGKILERLFEVFQQQYCSGKKSDSHLNLLSGDVEERINDDFAPENVFARTRLICDHLAGMSDDFVIRTYRRLFDVDFGSIVDIV